MQIIARIKHLQCMCSRCLFILLGEIGCNFGGVSVKYNARYWTRFAASQRLAYVKCDFLNARIKYPNSTTCHPISWLDNSYVELRLRIYYIWFRVRVNVLRCIALVNFIPLKCKHLFRLHMAGACVECGQNNIVWTFGHSLSCNEWIYELSSKHYNHF